MQGIFDRLKMSEDAGVYAVTFDDTIHTFESYYEALAYYNQHFARLLGQADDLAPSKLAC